MSTRPFKHNAQTLELFHPLEHAYLCDYLGIERPPVARALDPYAPGECDRVLDQDEFENDGVFRLRPDYEGIVSINAVPNAIARMALNGIQDRLPNWYCGWQGGYVKARHHEGRCLHRANLKPEYLFKINYADSGPGFSWPEDYHRVRFPHYDIWFVIASQDTPEVHGYADQVIGHYSLDEDPMEAIKRILIAWWTQGGDDPEFAWEALWDTGLIDSATIMGWRDEAFGLNQVDEDQEEAWT
jgi:hypothetical protein